MLGSCPDSFVAGGKRNNEDDFHLTEFLIVLVCCVSEINWEHHWICSWVVLWKFGVDKGAWTSKLDYSNGPYLQNMLKSCRTSQNIAETRDSRNTHIIPPSLSIIFFIFITSEGSPVPSISRVPLTSASEKSHNYMKRTIPRKYKCYYDASRFKWGSQDNTKALWSNKELNHATNGITLQSHKEKILMANREQN